MIHKIKDSALKVRVRYYGNNMVLHFKCESKKAQRDIYVEPDLLNFLLFQIIQLSYPNPVFRELISGTA